jgi:hypothetical protein
MGTFIDGKHLEIPGYSVRFPDGHWHWLAKDDFERYYTRPPEGGALGHK